MARRFSRAPKPDRERKPDDDNTRSLVFVSLWVTVAGRWPVVDRVARWSEATEDIAGLRRLVADGPLSIAPECRALARVGLSQAVVHSDDQGSVRLAKRRHGRSRDDVAAAGVLSVGALARGLARRAPRRRWRYRGMAA